MRASLKGTIGVGSALVLTSVASAARVLRVAPSTVRSHLKSIFVKAGVQRQSELVRLLSHLSRSLVGRRTLE